MNPGRDFQGFSALEGAERNRTALSIGCPVLTPEQGFRLAALADGEGCFSIATVRVTPGRLKFRPAAREVYACRFIVGMRADDAPFLNRMRAEVGLGIVRHIPASYDPVRNNRPSARWEIARKTECLAIVAIFDAYPLWSKKAAEFTIWREAVRFWAQSCPGDDLSFLAARAAELSAAREYREEAAWNVTRGPVS